MPNTKSPELIKHMEALMAEQAGESLSETDREMIRESLTVGQLIEILKGYNPNSPIEIEYWQKGDVPGAVMSGTVSHAFATSTTDNEGFTTVSIAGCSSDAWEQFKKDHFGPEDE